jgi:hypothetical protein
MRKRFLHLNPLRTFFVLPLLLLFSSAANSQYIPESEKGNPCPYIKTMQKQLEDRVKDIEEKNSPNRSEYRRIRKFLEESLETRSAGFEICDEVKSAIACLKEKENARPKLQPGDAETVAHLEKEIEQWKAKLTEFNCDAVANNEEYIKKLVGGWTDQPTPWGTPGGACQIKYANGKLTLINEDKKESGASISVNSDGSAVITASNWPVNGTVNKAGNSIKWSNKSEWTR